MNDVAREGRTILFVSHNLIALESLCSRALLLGGGTVRATGPTREIVARYLSLADSGRQTDLASKHRNGTGEIRFSAIHISSLAAEEGLRRDSSTIRAGEDFEIRLNYRSVSRVARPVFAISIFTTMSVPVFAIHTTDLHFEIAEIDSAGSIALAIRRPNLMPGRYLIHIAVGDSFNPLRYDHIVDVAELDIQPADVYNSGRISSVAWTIVFLDCEWRMQSTGDTQTPEDGWIRSAQESAANGSGG